ncbi:MAG: lysophospholipid acyltransferase family protein, partial [Planctomycetota bacterium]
ADEPRLYLVWHDSMLTPIYLRPAADLAILISKHRDADLLAAIAKCSGFGCVRGSTARGGVSALRELARRGRRQHLVITPDGPRGPRRRLAAGPIYLASRLGMPIVPIAVGYSQARRLNTWDRFGVPRLFSRAVVVLGEAMRVDADAGREAIEARRGEVEAEFLRLTRVAESWADGGEAPADATTARRQRPRGSSFVSRGSGSVAQRRAA